jgi:tryptophanyl-tRNA synthetase
MLTGELKQLCIKALQEFVKGFQERRLAVTDEIVDEFMRVRPLVCHGNPNAKKTTTLDEVHGGKGGGAGGQEGEGSGMTKSQLKKLAKQREIEEKKRRKAEEKKQKDVEKENA